MKRLCKARVNPQGGAAYHDASSSLQTLAEGSDIQQQQVLDLLTALSAQDGGLYSHTISISTVLNKLSETNTRPEKISTSQHSQEVDQQQVPLQATYLHCSTVGNSLIGIDGLAQLLAVEEVLEHLLHLGDTGGASHQHNLVHLFTYTTYCQNICSEQTRTVNDSLL
jgi:hypothetical protein